MHNQIEHLTCPSAICRQMFESKRSLTLHVKKTAHTEHACAPCHQHFPEESDLKKHVDIDHQIKCASCNFISSTKEDINKHEKREHENRDHEDSCSCYSCSAKAKAPEPAYRLLTNAMFLNQYLELQAVQFPSLQDFLHVVRPQNKVYCTVDFCSWYHQLPVSPAYKKMFTFSSFLGSHSYNRAAQGDASSPYAGQTTSRILLEGIEDSLPMIDDVLIAAATGHEMVTKLEKFFDNLERCSEPGMPLKIRGDKTHLLEDSVTFFGHKIVRGHVEASQEKIEQISNWEPPTTLQQLQSFLGLTSYLREFIKDYNRETGPLSALAKICPRNIGSYWKEEHQECFDKLQKTVKHLPNLRIFDETAKVHIYADA